MVCLNANEFLLFKFFFPYFSEYETKGYISDYISFSHVEFVLLELKFHINDSGTLSLPS